MWTPPTGVDTRFDIVEAMDRMENAHLNGLKRQPMRDTCQCLAARGSVAGRRASSCGALV